MPGSAVVEPASVPSAAVELVSVREEAEPASVPEAFAAASRSAISRWRAAGENRIVAPLSTSPPPNGPGSPAPSPDATGGFVAPGTTGPTGSAAGAAVSGAADSAAVGTAGSTGAGAGVFAG
ncbi:hypothetical protein ACN24K_21610 [Streptomyces microflavus]